MSKESRHTDPVVEVRKKTSPIFGKLGVFLILLSGVFFFSMLAVPWLKISGGYKVILGGALFVGVQVAWWVGAALVGPAAIGTIRSWLKRR
ncbi:MAG: hypothetical protein ACI87E_003947 [Mariniblastus sp.]|jgi:hypothetical protein